ncbi:MAG: tetratricopeptide repeat protein [Caulobacteraceae bacterium]
MDDSESASNDPQSIAPANLAVGLALQRAAKRARDGAEPASFLRKLEQLLDLQLKHYDEERRLRYSDLRLKRLSDGLKVAFEVSLAFVGLLIAIAIGAAVWSAARSNSVVVDAFQAPPDLAARGLGGEVLAANFLDDLTVLQAQTRSSASKRGLTDAWSGDIKLEVPQTGVSIGEIMRYLRGWLGHETHVGGDLVESADGVSLTVRGEGILPKTFTGPAADLPKLTTAAAEYVYGQSEPYLFASYLEGAGRDAEALVFIPRVFVSARPIDRPYLLNAWGDALGDAGQPRESLLKFQEALRLKPDFWIAYNNIANALWVLGDEEGAWRVGEAMRRKAGGRPGHAPELYYENPDLLSWNLLAFRAAQVGDMEANGGVGSAAPVPIGPSLADVDARLHDRAAAEFDLQTTPMADKDPTTVAMTHFVHGYLALEAGDFATAANEMEAFEAASAKNSVISNNYAGYGCWAVPAEEMAGHSDKADAALKAGGHFVDCYRFRGDILDHRGDWSGAQKAYAAAVALAPDLPAAYYSWGLALARHGDLRDAEAKYAAANARGPHWADPLKAWGDALAARGRRKEAEAKYAQALHYAPNWAALRLARGGAHNRTDKN